MLLTRRLIRWLVLTVVLWAFALGVSGRTDLVMLNLFLVLCSALVLGATVAIDPDLARERMRRDVSGEDPRRLALLRLLFLVEFGYGLLDVGRLHWTDRVPRPVQVAGLVTSALGFAWVLWAATVNRFFVPVIRIQSDRGHRVVSSGPYAVMRHPGYAGTLLAAPAAALAIGSWGALIPALALSATFLSRAAHEDRFLHANLPGYAEYTGRVRFRLVPGVWRHAPAHPLAAGLSQGALRPRSRRGRSHLAPRGTARRLGALGHEHARAALARASGAPRATGRRPAHPPRPPRGDPDGATPPHPRDVPGPGAGIRLDRGARGRRDPGAPHQPAGAGCDRPPDRPPARGSARASDPRPPRPHAQAAARARADRGPEARGSRGGARDPGRGRGAHGDLEVAWRGAGGGGADARRARDRGRGRARGGGTGHGDRERGARGQPGRGARAPPRRAMRGRRWIASVMAAGSVLLAVSAGCGKLLTTAPDAGDVFDAPLSGLSPADQAAFVEGDGQFGKAFAISEGLGPVFNNISCASCHSGDGRGRPENVLTRFSLLGNPVPELGGPQIQDRAIPGAEAEVLPAGVETSRRLPPPVFGMGLIEGVPVDSILLRADPADLDGDGISGRPNMVSVPGFVPAHEPGGTSPALGRFGRKAQVSTLLQQTVDAYHQDMGITTDFRPEENVNPLASRSTTAADRVADPEVPEGTVRAVVAYLRLLAPPAPAESTPRREQGRTLFAGVGCVSCHVPVLRTGPNTTPALAHRELTLYSDLLLHDMGDGLADYRTDGDADGREWRTTPLWGLRIMREFLNGEAFLLHDGRARSVEEAIQLHGGEAQAARDAFVALTADERAALLDFVESR